MADELDLLKSVPPAVLEQTYTDAAKATLQEVSKIGVDAVKTLRLALFPLQLASFFQDRVARYFSRALDEVPHERRIAPAQPLALQIADKLRYEEEASIVADMYVNLLARAMDRERVGQAHPAFVHLVGQLAPDEALLIQQLASRDLSAYMRLPGSVQIPMKEKRNEIIGGAALTTKFRVDLCDMMVRPEELGRPNLVYTYIEHLVSLGLVVYTNEPWKRLRVSHNNHNALDPYKFWFIQPNEFGRLFHLACLGDGGENSK